MFWHIIELQHVLDQKPLDATFASLSILKKRSKAGKGLEGCLLATGIHQQNLVFRPTVSNRFCQQVTCHTSSIWWPWKRQLSDSGKRRVFKYMECLGMGRSLWQKTTGPPSMGVGQEANYIVPENNTVTETSQNEVYREKQDLPPTAPGRRGVKAVRKPNVRLDILRHPNKPKQTPSNIGL